MKIKDQKSGISLIVLVITIIVIIILAVAVILSISNNNPIENARKASFQSNLKTIQEDVSLYIGKKYIDNNGKYDLEKCNFDGDAMLANFKSIPEEYKEKVSIVNGKVVLTDNVSKEESKWAKDIGITENEKVKSNKELSIVYIAKTEVASEIKTSTCTIGINYSEENPGWKLPLEDITSSSSDISLKCSNISKWDMDFGKRFEFDIDVTNAGTTAFKYMSEVEIKASDKGMEEYINISVSSINCPLNSNTKIDDWVAFSASISNIGKVHCIVDIRSK